MSHESPETLPKCDGCSIHPSTPPHALTREQCSLCTANRPRLCDQHYKQAADELLKQVTAAIQDQQTPGGVKATYEQLLELCNQQHQALAQQAQEVERLNNDVGMLRDEPARLKQQLAAMTAERDVMSNSREALVEVVRELRQQLAEAQGTVARLTDRIDLQCDEFQRISALTENDEIKGLCARAVKDIRQHVSVIQQRDQAEQQVARLRECLVEYMQLADKICYAEPELTQYHNMKTKASHALRETEAGKEDVTVTAHRVGCATAEQVEQYIKMADAELGPECVDAWVEDIRQFLRARYNTR